MDADNILNNGRKLCLLENIDLSNEIARVDMNDGYETEDHMHTGPCVEIDESVKDIHARVPKELIPEKGMEFENEKVALDFYKAYAKATGFGVRIWKSHIDKENAVILDRRFCCFREGERQSDVRDANKKASRVVTRCKCKAEMKISCRGTGKYRVVKFIAEHTHGCVSPSKSHLFRSHRKVSAAQKYEINLTISCGLAQKETMELMAKQAGGPEHLGFISDDCKNYLRTKRTNIVKASDTRGVLEYLQRKQADDSNFLYVIQVDEDGLITNIFWADGKMRSDYDHFGDVVCFDTTYKKHKDGRPIALFVGVNNHKQTIIFGVVLLYDETIPTFKWLFDVFAATMSGKKPQTILTDQDAAMANALASNWKDTYHRLCVWHINQNAAIHLSEVFSNCEYFAKDFSSCMYDHDDESDFIIAWNEMIKKYHLEENKWLSGMFQIRKKWALVYGRETFCANMSSTQRSESINSAIKGYISYKHDLSEFFDHFERLLKDRRYKESRADFYADQSVPSISFSVAIVKHAASIYTQKIFELFQLEVCKSHECNAEIYCEKDMITTYNVAFFGSHRNHWVIYDSKDGSVSCGCKKFNFVGILCSHALKVLNSKQIVRIPDQYIKRRWTKTAKRQNVEVEFQDMNQVDPKEVMGYRSKEISQLSRHLVSRAAESNKAYEIAKEGLQKLLEQIDLSFQYCEVQQYSSGTMNKGVTVEVQENTSQTCKGVIVDCLENGNQVCKKVRGIKSKANTTYNTSKRPKSGLEKVTNKKKATCKKSEKKKATNKRSGKENQEFVPQSEPQVCQESKSPLGTPSENYENLFQVNEIRPSQALHFQHTSNDKRNSVLTKSTVYNENLYLQSEIKLSQEPHKEDSQDYIFAPPFGSYPGSNMHPSENLSWKFLKTQVGFPLYNATGTQYFSSRRSYECDGRFVDSLNKVDSGLNEQQVSATYNPAYQQFVPNNFQTRDSSIGR